jgi:hypothetical protein
MNVKDLIKHLKILRSTQRIVGLGKKILIFNDTDDRMIAEIDLEDGVLTKLVEDDL